jgi:hypothetical protein
MQSHKGARLDFIGMVGPIMHKWESWKTFLHSHTLPSCARGRNVVGCLTCFGLFLAWFPLFRPNLGHEPKAKVTTRVNCCA